MNSRTCIDGSRSGLCTALFSAVLLVGCERPLPDTDKNPESGGMHPRQQSPTQPSEHRLPQQLRRSGPRTLVTFHQAAEIPASTGQSRS